MAVNSSLLTYIQAQLDSSVPKEKIVETLIAQGWSAEVIEEALAYLASGAAIPPTPPAATTATSSQSSGGTSDAATIGTIVALIFATPIGIILMWTITKWSKKLKWLLTVLLLILPVITILGMVAVVVLSSINPSAQIERGQATALRSDVEQIMTAADRYQSENGSFPPSLDAMAGDAGLKETFLERVNTAGTYVYQVSPSGDDCTLTVSAPRDQSLVFTCLNFPYQFDQFDRYFEK